MNGYLYAPGDDSGLRALVELLRGDEPLRLRMGEAGRRAVLGRSWEAVCDDLLGYYRSAIVERRLVLARQ